MGAFLRPRAGMTMWDSHIAIMGTCYDASNGLMHDMRRVTSITGRTWTQIEDQHGWHQE